MFSQLKTFSSSVHYLRGIIVLFTVILTVAGFFLLQGLVTSENERYAATERKEILQSAASLRADVEQSLNQRLFLISGLRSFVVANNFTVEEVAFQEFATALAEGNESVRSLQLAPEGVVKHVYPLAGNEAAVGHDLLVDDVRRDSVYEAIEQNAYIVTGPITLLQGGNALIARQPIYQFATSTALSSQSYSLDTFWGFATVLIDVDVIYKIVAQAAEENGYEVALRGIDGTGSTGDAFYGDTEVFASDPVLKNISLPVGSWEMAIVPAGGWETESPTSFWLLLIGLVSLGALIALCGLIIFSLRRPQEQMGADVVLTKQASERHELIYDGILALVVLGIVMYTLTAWGLGQAERQVFAGGALMNPLTASSFGLLALAVFCRWRLPQVTYAVLGLLLLIVSVRFAGIMGLINWQIDLALWRATIESASVPARMSVNTAVSFLLMISAVGTAFSAHLRQWRLPQALLALVSLLSGLVIFEYVFAQISVQSFEFFYSTSLLTAALFFILSLYVQFTLTRELVTRIGERLFILGGLVFCLVVAGLFANISTENYEQAAENKFFVNAERVRSTIENRMNVYINVLESGTGLFAASDRVDRDEWQAFVTSLSLTEEYPGIQGLGYSVFVSPEEKEDHEAAVQAEGFPEYAIKPGGERDRYSAIVYLEPFDVRNQQAFGFDMFQEPNRQAAMTAAQDTGKPHMSAMITLVQEIDNDVQAGFLIYVPQYRNGQPIDTVADRQANIEGFVYSPFRMRDLMEGTVPTDELAGMQLSIYDGNTETVESLMYQNTDTITADTARFTESMKFEIAGHTWTLNFASTPNYGVTTEQRVMPVAIMLIGLLIGVLLSAMLYAVFSSRQRAVGIAKAMTTKLETAKETLELATQSARIGVWTWDIKKNYLKWDEQMHALYGIKNDEFEGTDKAWLSLMQSEDREIVQEQLKKSMSAGSELMATFQALLPSGKVRFMKVNALIERDQAGQPIKMVGVNFDVTHEAEVDRAKTEFVSLASHQLRTPLSAINWFAQMLSAGDAGKLNKEQALFVQQIEDSNQRMVDLVDSLLNVSRIDLGTFAIEPEKLSLQKVAKSVIAELEPKIKDKQHKIKKVFDKNVPEMMADAKLTRIIFQNLISNAVKYTGDKGKITVSIEKKGKFVEIAVADTGYGIPKAQQDRVFEKLFRADNVREMETDGTGLGLYIIKAIAEEVGGKAWFESEEGEGTTFHVTLPLKGMAKKDGNKELD